MVVDKKVLDNLSEQAKANPRLRQAMDLRNSPDDLSQRMLMRWSQGLSCLFIDIMEVLKPW